MGSLIGRCRLRRGRRADARLGLLGWRLRPVRLPTTYDGYDTVEAVAAQTWVKGGKVGMVGISFSGITQLFTAGTRPPHLAADRADVGHRRHLPGPGFPGGIFNSGFAQTWIQERMDDAEPAPAGGQPWAQELAGAATRTARQPALRLQTQDALELQKGNPYRTPSLFAHARARGVAQACERAGVPGRPVPGRANQRALPGESRRT